MTRSEALSDAAADKLEEIQQERRQYFLKHVLPGTMMDILGSVNMIEDIPDLIEIEYLEWRESL